MALDEILKLSDGSFLNKTALLAGDSLWKDYDVDYRKDGMIDLGSMRLYRRVTVRGNQEDGTKIQAWGIWDRLLLDDKQIEDLRKAGLFFTKSEE